MRIPSLYLCISTLMITTGCSSEKNTDQDTVEEEQEEVEVTDVGPDLDGDGIADEHDLDADGDGVDATEDCDDTNSEILSNAEDLDCDGIPDSEDTDQDGDGIDASIDCDDQNPDANSMDDDEDCDGVSTNEDCDDTNAELGSSNYDVDCDGYLSYEDCDDRNPNSTLVENDTDCDGIVNEEDVFPENAAESTDSDGDGVGDNTDLCEGGDDSVDEDGNGVPDHCDQPGWLNCTSDRVFGTATYQFTGTAENEESGYSISYAGDVDGDGLEDLLIGTHNYYVPDPLGRVYLVLGSSMTPGQEFDLSNADYIFTSEQEGDRLGLMVAGVGDYDGDGLDDMLFGAKEYGTSHGRAYLVLGSSLGSESAISMADADTKFYSTQSQEYLGTNLAAGGDVNGDGLADIIIGHSYNTNRVYVFYGTSVIQSERHVESANVIINGQNGSGEDFDVADVDGDGLSDLIIGEPYYGTHNRGRIHVILGASIGSQTSVHIDDSDYKFVSYSDQYLGLKVSSAGDLDGDGLDDVMMASHDSDISGANSGSAYIMLGSTLANATSSEFDVYDADYKIYGANNNDAFGRDIGLAGDINGDGMSDILVAASGSTYGGPGTGTVFLFSGASLPYLASGNEINPLAADFRLIGDSSIGSIGRLPQIPGDLDGDGFDDVMISSHYANSYAGLVNVFNNCE